MIFELTIGTLCRSVSVWASYHQRDKLGKPVYSQIDKIPEKIQTASKPSNQTGQADWLRGKQRLMKWEDWWKKKIHKTLMNSVTRQASKIRLILMERNLPRVPLSGRIMHVWGLWSSPVRPLWMRCGKWSKVQDDTLNCCENMFYV